MSAPSLDIILPCFNPPEGWVGKVVAAVEVIAGKLPGVGLRIILVNDGSTRGLEDSDRASLKASLAERGHAFRYIAYAPNRGKGYALRAGVRVATNDLQIYTDIDFPYQEESLVNLYHLLAQDKADVVAGVRDGAYYTNVPAGRRRISRILRWMLRTFLRLQITDTQCGLKGFNAQGKALFLQTTIRRFLFDLEFIFLASNDASIALKPAEVELKPDVVFSRVNPRILLREGFNFLRIFLRGIRRQLFSRSSARR